MRICFLSDPRYLHTQRWARYFADRGHEVMIVGGPEAERVEVPGIHTRPLGAERALRRIRAEFRPDIMHMHYLNPLIAPMLLRFRPFLVSVWGADILGEAGLVRESKRIRWYKRALLHYADAVLALSEQLACATSRYAGLPPSRITVRYWGVDRQ